MIYITYMEYQIAKPRILNYRRMTRTMEGGSCIQMDVCELEAKCSTKQAIASITDIKPLKVFARILSIMTAIPYYEVFMFCNK